MSGHVQSWLQAFVDRAGDYVSIEVEHELIAARVDRHYDNVVDGPQVVTTLKLTRRATEEEARQPGTLWIGDDTVVEHALRMSGGGMHVRSADPDVEWIYPLDQWIGDHQRDGGRVYRRRVRVVEDWVEVESR